MATTAQQVKNLIPGCSVDDAIVESIVTDATNLVTGLLTDCDELSTAETNGVIKWLSAHMLASGPCRQAKREKLGEAEVEYDGQKGVDLSSTSFGRMAIALDRCGKLGEASKRTISIKAVTSFE